MYFMEKVTIRSINEFNLEKELLKNITTWLHLDRNEIVYIFMTQDLLSTEQTKILYCSQCW